MSNDEKTQPAGGDQTPPAEEATQQAPAVDEELTEAAEVDEDATAPRDARTEVLGGGDAMATARLDGLSSSATAVIGGVGGGNPLVAMQPGYVLRERFRLQRKLGEGGMGAVFLAEDQRKVEAKHHNPAVAIKLISGDFSRDPRAFIALQRETDKSQTLAHPNIITVYDFDRDGDIFYMTMEALIGSTLDELISGAKCDRKAACNFIEQIARGIAYAHQRDIVHSDLKPPNIFVTEEGVLKILDFGIARALSAAASNDPGEIVGLTPAYASCEMFEKQDPHPADDVYALGLIAYELLTGEHPFGRKKAIEAREQGLKPKRIRGLSKYQWHAIAKALSFDRKERLQNAEQFLRKFTGAGRRVQQLSAALLVALVTFAAYTYFYTPEAGPDIPFEALPAETQATISEQLREAQQAMKFGDFNGALYYLDKAYSLHPRNLEVVAALDQLVGPIVKEMSAATDAGQRAIFLSQVRELLKYESLAQDPELVELRKQLESAGP
ncbi:serine/threonine-protein kinase [Spongiibacter sp.]|uniref:serine/threonine-protein kinase n=1 Tax=Spongiibacter sp. TaxID=2024860 RepID=UPI00356929F0